MDSVIRGGTVVTSDNTVRADVGIRDGRITQVGGSMSGDVEIDAGGLLVVPGGIDAHVHFTNDFRLNWLWVDDFFTGSVAAATGGVTCIGNVSFAQPDESLLAALDRTEAEATSNSIVDFIQHPVVLDPSPQLISEIPSLAKAGHLSVKFFTMIEERGELDHVRAMEAAGRSGLLIMAHCEDQVINDYMVEHLRSLGNTSIEYYPDSRPTYGEAVATAKALAIARSIGAPIYVVHLSCRAALDQVRTARMDGQRVYVETRPIYLFLNRERYRSETGPLYVSFPPLRHQSDVDALWTGIQNGEITTYCSDHAPLDRAQSLNPKSELGSFGGAMAGTETLLPLLYSEGVRPGRISHNQWVALTSTNAAKVFGMYPRKGTIEPGADADIVVWDPELSRVIHAAEMRSNSDFDVFDGFEVHGWPVYTISRGEVIFDHGRVVGRRGRGRPASRQASVPV